MPSARAKIYKHVLRSTLNELKEAAIYPKELKERARILKHVLRKNTARADLTHLTDELLENSYLFKQNPNNIISSLTTAEQAENRGLAKFWGPTGGPPTKAKIGVDLNEILFSRDKSTLGHELFHTRKDRNALAESATDKWFEEKAADQFGEAVRTRALGGAKENIPTNFRRWIKAVPLTTALVGGEEDEAEAFPIKKMLKAGEVILTGQISRAAKGLKGTAFKEGIIKSVTKGKGDWRYVVLEDDTVYPVTKDVVSNLMRKQGTEAKMAEFSTKAPTQQLEQALISARYHGGDRKLGLKGRTAPLVTKPLAKAQNQYYTKELKTYGFDEHTKYSTVRREGRTFTMPTSYAKVLEEQGLIKVLEDLD